MTTNEVEARLRRIGQGACVSLWNDSFDVQRLDSPCPGNRRVLSSGLIIDGALFDRADERVAYLKSVNAW